MKRKIAFVLALTLTASMLATGCGKTDETKTGDDTASSVTETVSGTESGTDGADSTTEAATESGASKTDLFTNIKFASKSSYTVPEVGKYETYLDGFKLPENVAYVTAEDNGSGMLFAKANGIMYMHLNFDAPANAMNSTEGASETEDESNVKTDEPLQDAAAEAADKEEKTKQADAEMKGELGTVSTGDIAPAEKTHIDAAVFIDSKYTYLSLSTGDSDKAVTQRAELGKDKDSDDELNDMVNSLEGMDKTTFAFTEYAGEETIDGTAYDVISAVMTTVDDDEHEAETAEPTEESTNVKVYFTKDGSFYTLKFDLDESTKGTLYEIESITIPDAEWQDVEATELGKSLFGTFMLMVAGSDGVNFSDTDDTDVDTTDSPAADNSEASETSEAAETTEAPESEDSAAETAVSFTVLDQ